MGFWTLVKCCAGMAVFAGVALAAVLVLQSVEYAAYTVGAVVMCVAAVLVVLEPELRGNRY